MRIIGTQSNDTERMNVGLHQRAERSIDHPMALDGPFAGEMPRANPHVEVAATVARTGMARMATAVVDDLELIGLERGLEAPADQRDALGALGRPCRTGLISTAPNTPSRLGTSRAMIAYNISYGCRGPRRCRPSAMRSKSLDRPPSTARGRSSPRS